MKSPKNTKLFITFIILCNISFIAHANEQLNVPQLYQGTVQLYHLQNQTFVYVYEATPQDVKQLTNATTQYDNPLLFGVTDKNNQNTNFQIIRNQQGYVAFRSPRTNLFIASCKQCWHEGVYRYSAFVYGQNQQKNPRIWYKPQWVVGNQWKFKDYNGNYLIRCVGCTLFEDKTNSIFLQNVNQQSTVNIFTVSYKFDKPNVEVYLSIDNYVISVCQDCVKSNQTTPQYKSVIELLNKPVDLSSVYIIEEISHYVGLKSKKTGNYLYPCPKCIYNQQYDGIFDYSNQMLNPIVWFIAQPSSIKGKWTFRAATEVKPRYVGRCTNCLNKWEGSSQMLAIGDKNQQNQQHYYAWDIQTIPVVQDGKYQIYSHISGGKWINQDNFVQQKDLIKIGSPQSNNSCFTVSKDQNQQYTITNQNNKFVQVCKDCSTQVGQKALFGLTTQPQNKFQIYYYPFTQSHVIVTQNSYISVCLGCYDGGHQSNMFSLNKDTQSIDKNQNSLWYFVPVQEQ